MSFGTKCAATRQPARASKNIDAPFGTHLRSPTAGGRGVTQSVVLKELGVSQANVSRVEHEEEVYLSVS